jgi:hypothetical protein
MRPSIVGLIAAAAIAPTLAKADIVPAGPSHFGPGSNTITFNELPVGVTIPFSIGMASFTGLSGSISNLPQPPSASPPAPSGGPYLYTETSDNQDIVEVLFGAPQESVGAYFNVEGSTPFFGVLQVEFYSGSSLLGILPATPEPGEFGGFAGGSAGAAVIDRVIFRDIDPTLPVSFRLDDVTFAVPEPASLCLFASSFVVTCVVRRRNR